MTARRLSGPRRGVFLTAVLALVVAACGESGRTVDGADVDRPSSPSIELVTLTDVAAEIGLDFRHGAFQWEATGDPNAMMGGGVCWIDVDNDGWLDLFVVNTWSNGEWGRWREQGALPSTRLFHNDRGKFTDVSEEMGAALEVRGNGCVAADLDRDGHTDLYVTTERANILLWNDDGRHFEIDSDAGVDANGWQAGAAVGDINGDGWLDLFVAGYADLNRPIPGATKGFPNSWVAEPDLLFISQGAEAGGRPRFVDVATEAGIEVVQTDYGLGALLSDVDLDGDLDLYVANDTNPNRLYINEPSADALGFRFVDQGQSAGVDDDNAGMGVAAGDYDADGLPDLVVTNMGDQGHAVFRSGGDTSAPRFRFALDEMGQPDLGQGLTGWGTAWSDLDLDGDLDLMLAHGAIPVTDLAADREQLQAFENLASSGQTGVFAEVTSTIGLGEDGTLLARGLAAADYDNDGDLDFAVGTIGGDLALFRNNGAGGRWLVVDTEPAVPGTIVTVTSSDGGVQRRELTAGSSYLSSEDPRSHFGLGDAAGAVTVEVVWPDGDRASQSDVDPDQIIEVRPR